MAYRKSKYPQMLVKTNWIDNLVGYRFGRWKVLKFGGYVGRGDAMFKCLCDCGTERRVRAANLRDGSSTSCGCLRRENAIKASCKPPGEAGLNSLFRAYVTAAKQRDFEFKLTKAAFKKLTQRACFYCGAPPTAIGWTHDPTRNSNASAHSAFAHNGIDRVDSALGYTISNSVPCCKPCNTAKSDYALEAFFENTAQRYFHLKEKGLVE